MRKPQVGIWSCEGGSAQPADIGLRPRKHFGRM
nr:MAG TPA: hypothetical protein [Caudoviricetes sp.]